MVGVGTDVDRDRRVVGREPGGDRGVGGDHRVGPVDGQRDLRRPGDRGRRGGRRRLPVGGAPGECGRQEERRDDARRTTHARCHEPRPPDVYDRPVGVPAGSGHDSRRHPHEPARNAARARDVHHPGTRRKRACAGLGWRDPRLSAMSSPTLYARLLAPLAVAALLATSAGCGGDEKESAAPPPSDPSSSASETPSESSTPTETPTETPSETPERDAQRDRDVGAARPRRVAAAGLGAARVQRHLDVGGQGHRSAAVAVRDLPEVPDGGPGRRGDRGPPLPARR